MVLDMNNEPVAWMLADKEAEHIRSIMAVQHDFVPKGCIEIPLYTHPAKTLTDEEIGDFTHRMVLCCQVHPSSADINVLGLKFIVEDILRKAQEK